MNSEAMPYRSNTEEASLVIA